MVHPECFYRREGETWCPTPATRGPWDPRHQHGGPPAALLGRGIERYGEDASAFVVTRLTVELLRPIPVDGRLRVDVAPVRLGGEAQRLTASLRDEDDTELARAAGLRIREVATALPDRPRHPEPPRLPSVADSSAAPPGIAFRWDVGYHTAIDLRVARGTWGQGPCAAWLRSKIPLVEGEPLTSLQRVAIAADAGNGVALVLDPGRYRFVNPDLSITMARRLRGEWVGLDARASATASGTGLVDCEIHDEDGALGRSLQCLVVRGLG